LTVDVLVAGKLTGDIRENLPENTKPIPLSRSFLPWIPLRRALRCFQDNAGADNSMVPLPATPPRAVRFLPDLVRYLSRERPDGLIVAGTHYNLIALWAKRLARVQTRVVVSERNSMQEVVKSYENRDDWRWRHTTRLVADAYPSAHAIVANSHGVAADLAHCTGLHVDTIKTIYNPIVSGALEEKALQPVDHPWFAPGMPPVVLGVGRLHPQKDFGTLIKAFARVRSQRDARLIILGDDRGHAMRNDLLSLAENLGVSNDLDLAGFSSNPFSFMAKAAVFVLSSQYEGCPNVLVEALACGCPVVSTRCPHGPDEILEDGKYGTLVEVGDEVAMAEAISATLDTPQDRDFLRERAAQFGFDPAVEQYLACI
jgi:glycosyltransferase involved in cell wall biosynthesis